MCCFHGCRLVGGLDPNVKTTALAGACYMAAAQRGRRVVQCRLPRADGTRPDAVNISSPPSLETDWLGWVHRWWCVLQLDPSRAW